MSLNLPQQSLVSSSSSNALLSRDPIRTCFSSWGGSRKKWRIKLALSADGNVSLSCRLINSRKYSSTFRKSRRGHIFRVASADDGVTVNGSTQARSSSDANEVRVKLDQSLESKDYNNGLVQTLHDAARVFELAIKEQSSSLKMSWFSTAWLGVDKNAWVKGLAYQGSVYALLQAGIEISSRGDDRDRDINVFVQRSLLRQSGPLESVLREKLSAKQLQGYELFLSEQVPAVATSFINYFESNPRFAAATAVFFSRFGKGKSPTSSNANEISLLMLALSCIAAITKLGPTKIACSQFFSMLPDTTGRLMDMLVNFIPIRQAYSSVKDIGLGREFLVHFGPRAAAYKAENDRDVDEVVFWVSLFQKQLQRAIHRERIWSRLTTCESIEVLEKDLSVFGFFIALGRSSQSFLSVSGFDVIEEPLEGFLRYLIGGSVLYYPQLSSISSYQLYVDVVCEELEWLPFYPGITSTSKIKNDHKSKQERIPNAEAVSQVLDVCSYWIQSFIKYSKLLESPSNVKAARFLSRGLNKLMECMGELGIQENHIKNPTERTGRYLLIDGETDSSFNKALESVEEAMVRLEKLLQELHVSSSSSGKEQLKAACSDLERIRRLKKEAEFLEASFSAKAASLRQGEGDNGTPLSISDQQQQYRGKNRKTNVGKSNLPALWNFLLRQPSRDSDPISATAEGEDEEVFDKSYLGMDPSVSQSDEIQRFEILRNELLELERRVQGSANTPEVEEEEIKISFDTANRSDAKGGQLLVVQKKENILEKSLDKLKETTTDIWQGTQLLAIDVGAASGLLRRILIGDDLTEKEKKALQRTLTDVAAVVPIGILMLLPVTAVGHAAMLAAIQRYVPSLIPSTYGQERLSLLRQLEKVKELEKMETCENVADEPE